MAIRPADLQLAYLAAPQNAAQVSNAQTGPQAAQAASQAAFAAQVQKREETVAETAHAEGSVIRANPDGSNGGQGWQGGKRRGRGQGDQSDFPQPPADGEHFIDVTA
jgi:hypothetical protein